MRKVAICNFKGGVGKTTCAVNLAIGLARAGRRVLLLDNDAQANATDALGINNMATAGTYGLIVGGDKPEALAVTMEERLDMIPTSRALAPVDQWLAMQTRREEILKKRLAPLRRYDFVLLDTAPAFSLLNLNALTYASEIWLPVSMDYLSLQGARQVVESVQMIREELEHVVTVRYVIPTFYDVRNAKTKAVYEALTASFGAAVTSPIRANVRLSEAPSYHQSIFDYAPHSTGADDFRTLVRSILADEAQTPARR
jgi:chromosome partitioning protein